MFATFDVHVTVHRDKFLIIKPTRCINFSNLFLKWNSTCFGQFLCPSSGVFHCTHSNGICYTGLLTACEQVPARKLSAKPIWHTRLLCIQCWNPDDGQRNCPKHVEFHSKIKFWEISASSWFYYKKISRDVKLFHTPSNGNTENIEKRLVRNSKLGVFDYQQNGEGRSAFSFGVLCQWDI